MPGVAGHRQLRWRHLALEQEVDWSLKGSSHTQTVTVTLRVQYQKFLLTSLMSFRLVPRRAFLTKRLFSTHRLTRSCPSCAQPLPTCLPACPNCWNIWSIPADTSYHNMFSLPENSNPFVIDTAQLKQRFRQMQSACHPDTWASKGQVSLHLPTDRKVYGSSSPGQTRRGSGSLLSRQRCVSDAAAAHAPYRIHSQSERTSDGRN